MVVLEGQSESYVYTALAIVVIMDRSMTLLCLLLLTSTHAYRFQLVSRTVPDSFTNSNGPLYTFSFATLPAWSGDTAEWTVSSWIYIASTTYDSMNVLTITDIALYFALDTTLNWWDSFSEVPAEATIKVMWFHVLMGSANNVGFGVVTKRSGAQYIIPYFASLVSGTTEFFGSNDTTLFNVRDM